MQEEGNGDVSKPCYKLKILYNAKLQPNLLLYKAVPYFQLLEKQDSGISPPFLVLFFGQKATHSNPCACLHGLSEFCLYLNLNLIFILNAVKT